MQFTQINRQLINRATKRAFILSLVLMAVFGALIAKALTDKREASGEVTIELCRKDGSGGWKVIDRAKTTTSFTASVIELASGKEARTDFTWNGTSEKGRKLTVRWGGPAKFKFDPTRGLLEVNVTFDTTIDGKKISFPAKLTTESVSSPTGQLSGQRAVLSNGTLTAGLVGFSTIKAKGLIEEAKAANKVVVNHEEQKKGGIRTPGTVGGSAGLVEELVVVIKGKGKAVAR
jgi:hypothetical protein